MLRNEKISPKYDAFLAVLENEPPYIKAIWRYAIFLLMIDTERARVIETHQDGEILYVIVQTRAGDRFEVVRPAMSDEQEQQLLEQVREIFKDDESI